MARACASHYRLRRIEAHPLNDGRLRVWVRVQNMTKEDREAQVACNFRTIDRVSERTRFVHVTIPAGNAIDACFVAPVPEVAYYPILVR